MFTNLLIHDFQSIHDVDLELGRVTVLSGPSSSGKSAVVRSFVAALSNPRGSASVRSGTKEARVAVVAEGGDGIEYRKSSKGSTTYFSKAGEHSAVGSAVPDEVLEFFNLSPASVGRQFDPLFLLTESPSKAAAHFGALTHDYVLQAAVSFANKQKSEAATEAKVHAASASEYAARAAEAAPLLEELSDRRDTLALRLESFQSRTRLADRLHQALREATQAEALASTLRAQDAAFRSVEITLEDHRVALLRANERVQVLSRAVAEATALHAQVRANEDLLLKLDSEYDEFLKKQDSLRCQLSVCPLCEQSVDDDAEEAIVRNARSVYTEA